MSEHRPAHTEPTFADTGAQAPLSHEPAAAGAQLPRTDEPAPAGTQASQTYETAAARVEEIIRRLDSGEASLNETLELVGEGKALIEFCAHELQAVSGALEELRLDELVARLESQVSES
jgi:exodeoxyribonuclease VII small subunit